MTVATMKDMTAAPKESINHSKERKTRNHHALKSEAEASGNEMRRRECNKFGKRIIDRKVNCYVTAVVDEFIRATRWEIANADGYPNMIARIMVAPRPVDLSDDRFKNNGQCAHLAELSTHISEA